MFQHHHHHLSEKICFLSSSPKLKSKEENLFFLLSLFLSLLLALHPPQSCVCRKKERSQITPWMCQRRTPCKTDPPRESEIEELKRHEDATQTRQVHHPVEFVVESEKRRKKKKKKQIEFPILTVCLCVCVYVSVGKGTLSFPFLSH